jgi:hypothetical protein
VTWKEIYYKHSGKKTMSKQNKNIEQGKALICSSKNLCSYNLKRKQRMLSAGKNLHINYFSWKLKGVKNQH